MNQLIRLGTTTSTLLIPVVLLCFALLPKTQAVSPPPDGCYPNYTTAEGCSALNSLTTGTGNTGVGWYSLFSNTDASYNTGVGAGTLVLNAASSNTAVGTGAMLLNTSGSANTAVGTNALVYNDSGIRNNAVGAFALFNNVSGIGNNAFGSSALFQNISAGSNTAIGDLALLSNDVTGAGLGNFNTAIGAFALISNTDGNSNTAVGYAALNDNVLGGANTAVGRAALFANDGGSANSAIGDNALGSNNTGSENVAIGAGTLSSNVNGSHNTVVGWEAGNTVEGSDNIYIGRDTADGITAESATTRIGNDAFVTDCYIAGILGNGPFGADVQIDPVTGRLGSNASSKRFKKDIDPMDRTSEAIYSLKPVTFHYKNDQTNMPQFGLIAEEVAKVNPALIAMDKEGKPYTVRYDQVNAMLLNEFLKEHHKVQDLESRLAQQEKQIEWLTAGLQKVSVQLETSRPAPRVAVNKQ